MRYNGEMSGSDCEACYTGTVHCHQQECEHGSLLQRFMSTMRFLTDELISAVD